jgi:integrase
MMPYPLRSSSRQLRLTRGTCGCLLQARDGGSRRAVFTIDRDRWEVMVAGVAPSTLRMYETAIRKAIARGAAPFLPAVSVDDVMGLFLPMKGESWTAITTLRQAVTMFQAMAGFQTPPFDGKALELFFKGLHHSAPTPTGGSAPMTLEVAAKLFRFWEAQRTLVATRNLTFMTLQLATLQRFSQVAEAVAADFVDQGLGKGFLWFIPHSKTDQRGVGQTVPIPEQIKGGLQVAAVLRRFLLIAPTDGGALFRPTTLRGTAWAPPVGPTSPGMRPPAVFTNQSWNSELRAAIGQACPEAEGFHFTSHSFRSGGATNLLEQGLSYEECRALLGHRSLNAVHAYHRQRVSRTATLLSSLYAPSPDGDSAGGPLSTAHL